MKVKLMGGPSMGKVMELHPDVIRRGRLEVAWSNPPSMQWADFSTDPTTSIQVGRGYYQPSHRAGVWTFVGKYEGDEYKSYERRKKLWNSKIRKLQAQGVPSHLWPSPPSMR